MDFSSLNPITSNALSLAARKNDVQTVHRLLKKLNPNCIDNRGWTCLHEAAACDSYQSLSLILKHPDCRPLSETHEGHTALYLACRHVSSIQTIKALLDSVEDIVNYGSTECVTPLHIASAQGRIDVMQLLIEYGAMLDVQDFDGDTPLHDAALGAQHEAVATLLHAGADPEIKNETNYTAFHLACFKGCYETIVNLFPFVNNINQVTLNGDTPLMLATQGCNDEIIQFLLQHGADPHVKNVDGELALDMALNTHGCGSIFSILLAATDTDKINKEIILHACKPHNFQLEVIEAVLKHDLGPEFFDFVEPFHVTLEQIGDIRPVYLTNAPLNSYLNVCDYIYCCSIDNFREFFYLFLIRGASVNPVNKNECPPLVYMHYCPHDACFEDVFGILIEHGCNVDYSSYRSEQCIPDAFIAALTSDSSTLPLMLPYSLYVEPGDLLQFAYDNNLLGRIPTHVIQQILSMIDDKSTGASAEYLPYFVPSLAHLSRLKVRSLLRSSGVNSTKRFLHIVKSFHIPIYLKNFLRYL